MILSMTRPAAWLSVRRDSDPGEFKIVVRSFSCMNRMSASGSSSLGRRFAMPCMAEALSRAMLGCDTRREERGRGRGYVERKRQRERQTAVFMKEMLYCAG